MNIAVCVKHAIDEGELRADSAGRPQLQGAMSKMSTFDRNAVEEAVRIKESRGGSVTVVSIGAAESRKTVKEALAMGCDRAVLVVAGPGTELDALSTSYYLSQALRRGGPFDLVVLSEGASDTYHGLVGPMVAEWLGLPFLGYARRVELGDGTVRVEAALDERTESDEAPLPAALSVVSEVNTPRYPTLLQIMQASKKPLEELTLDSLKDERAPQASARVIDVVVQSVNRKRVIYEGGAEESSQKLLDSLRKEGVISR
jgi:electron transfer flavoprotein beta subunit